MTSKEQLWYLIKGVVNGSYQVNIFCDEFTRVYYFETDYEALTEHEQYMFSEMAKMAVRYSEYEEDLKIPHLYFSDEEIISKAKEIDANSRYKRKTVFIDTNCQNEDGSIKIHELIVKNMRLQHGEKVIAYQEEDWWDAEIVQKEDCWSVEILSEPKRVSKERQDGHREGFTEGRYAQSIFLLRVLQNLNYSVEEIEKVKEKLGLK